MDLGRRLVAIGSLLQKPALRSEASQRGQLAAATLNVSIELAGWMTPNFLVSRQYDLPIGLNARRPTPQIGH